jgi:hypothetical protein
MTKKRKSISERIEQLNIALRALKNANDNYIKTKDDAYLLDLMGRLRALVGLGGQFMQPLLINISNELKIPLIFYSYPPKPKKGSKGLIASVMPGKNWSVFPKKGFVKCNLEDWLKFPAYFSDTTKEFKDRNQVLKDISNTEGGSHYTKETPHIVDVLSRWKTSNEINGIKNFLFEISPLVFWLSNRMVKLSKIEAVKRSVIIRDDFRKKRVNEINSEISRLDTNFDELKIGMNVGEIQLYGKNSG